MIEDTERTGPDLLTEVRALRGRGARGAYSNARPPGVYAGRHNRPAKAPQPGCGGTVSEGGAWEMTDNDTWYLAIRCELRAISWAIAEVRDSLHGGRPLRTEDESERS